MTSIGDSLILYTKTILAGIWVGSSLGTPLIASLYVDCLGSTVDLECYGPGLVQRITQDDTSIRFEDSYFIYNLGSTVMFPIYLFLGPFAIPVSLIYSLMSTVNYLVYVGKLICSTTFDFICSSFL
jgi:hypothetical protein